MICVLATIRVREGERGRFLEIFNANVPRVRQEEGCLEYFPAVDLDSGLPVQQSDPNAVTVVEKWQSVAALHEHLASPHMLQYKEQVKDLVESVSLKVLRQA